MFSIYPVVFLIKFTTSESLYISLGLLEVPDFSETPPYCWYASGPPNFLWEIWIKSFFLSDTIIKSAFASLPKTFSVTFLTPATFTKLPIGVHISIGPICFIRFLISLSKSDSAASSASITFVLVGFLILLRGTNPDILLILTLA